MTKTLLEVKGLKKYFPIVSGLFRKTVGFIKAVDNIDFKIMQGQVLGMVGESGSGKSTAARSCIRLIEPTAGKISFKGQDFLTLDSKKLILITRLRNRKKKNHPDSISRSILFIKSQKNHWRKRWRGSFIS